VLLVRGFVAREQTAAETQAFPCHQRDGEGERARRSAPLALHPPDRPGRRRPLRGDRVGRSQRSSGRPGAGPFVPAAWRLRALKDAPAPVHPRRRGSTAPKACRRPAKGSRVSPGKGDPRAALHLPPPGGSREQREQGWRRRPPREVYKDSTRSNLCAIVCRLSERERLGVSRDTR
jgi:hypothetical protein